MPAVIGWALGESIALMMAAAPDNCCQRAATADLLLRLLLLECVHPAT
jgi:hypothetical protein